MAGGVSAAGSAREQCLAASDQRGNLTVLVPAYNEAVFLPDTIRSLQKQTLPPDEIIVIDDGSDDGTGEIAASLGVTVLRPPQNTGTKAGAQNFALERVRTRYVMAVDADTVLARDAIEQIVAHGMTGVNVAAACGFVVPRFVKSVWERGRYVEYLFAFSFFKPVQDFYRKPLIASGCFSVYRTDVIQRMGGWSTRTLAEDMDLTWSLYREGWQVRFVPEAVCYPIEPQSFHLMRKQLRRWSHGFIQNFRLHWRGVLDQHYLRSLVFVAFLDALFASIMFVVLLPLLAIFLSPAFLAGYALDIACVAIPMTVAAKQRGEIGRAYASLPAFFIVRFLNAIIFLWAAVDQLLLRRSFMVYEKGH